MVGPNKLSLFSLLIKTLAPLPLQWSKSELLGLCAVTTVSVLYPRYDPGWVYVKACLPSPASHPVVAYWTFCLRTLPVSNLKNHQSVLGSVFYLKSKWALENVTDHSGL